MTQGNDPQEEPLAPIVFGSTVTILFSDIRGFTEFTDAHGDEAAYRMLQHHNNLLKEQIRLYNGHIVKTQGDSFMVSFPSARTAITCAVAIQRVLDQYNRTQQGPKIEIGIGINTGEPVREAEDLFGGAVNLASRICAVAGPGRILISEGVHHVVGKLQGAQYIDRGFFELKGFQQPQHLFDVDWSGVGAVLAPQVASPHERARSGGLALSQAETAEERRKHWLPWSRASLIIGALMVLGVMAVGVWWVAQNSAVSAPGQALTTSAIGERVTLPGGQVARVQFHDDFANPNTGIFDKAGKGDDFDFRYVDGQFLIRVFTGVPLRDAMISALESRKFTDFAAEMETRATRLPEAAEYGLAFRGVPGRGQYYFGVRPDSQSWRLVFRRRRGEEAIQFNSGVSPAIRKGLEPNRLLVVAKGPAFSVYVNGQHLTTFADDTAAEGFLGVVVLNLQATDKDGLNVSVSHFTVYALEP